MGIACPLRRGDAVGQHLTCFVEALSADQSLRCHEIPGGVVGIGCQQFSEFGQRAFKVSVFRVLHGESVAREGIVWTLGQDVRQHSYAIHKTVLSSVRRDYYMTN